MILSIKKNDYLYTSNEGVRGLVNLGVPEEDAFSAFLVYLERAIDTAAGNARAAFVSPGALVEQEYKLIQQEAESWLEAGADETKVPGYLQAHLDAYGGTARQAVDAILGKAAQLNEALMHIRTLRMQGKAAVRTAETIDAAEQAAQQAIEQLNRFPPDAA